MHLVVHLLMLALMGAIFVFSIVVICYNGRAIKRVWRIGLLFASVIFLLNTGSTIINLYFMDLKNLPGIDQTDSDLMQAVIYTIIICAVVAALIIQWAWYTLVFTASFGEWTKAGLPGFALLIPRKRNIKTGVRIGAIFGILAGVFSTVIFIWLNIGIGPMLAEFESLLIKIEQLPLLYRLIVYSILVVGPAITEELTFRGLMLGFFMRVCNNNKLQIACAYFIVSMLWALLHIPNTDMPIVKVLQIFLIGLVLCELARRFSLESAIAGHILLNLSAVVCSIGYD